MIVFYQFLKTAANMYIFKFLYEYICARYFSKYYY